MNGINDTTPGPYAARWERHEAARRAAAMQNRRIVFDTLTRADIESITVSFNGEGDSGQVEDIAVLPEERIGVLDTSANMTTVPWPGCDLISEPRPLRDLVEDVCYAALSETHGGWENNDGAYGEFTFDVAEREITLEFNERYVATEYYEHSWTEDADHGT
ncbi:hypothetical protein LU298_06315 [Komagataeibacter intermedius]|uniref:DUF6878 family protein n=1 Tax=Acetobacteraceae TaxID=433 RepID=UPI00094FFCCA|nr:MULTISPECIES: DUF6878 family protein [Acetobacteraceae]MCF3636114.1 hypothetical protein [Komagataeibacter intermedius]WEQ54957.1 hypothetical protein LV564_12600 [Komagataeibacter nataicola]